MSDLPISCDKLLICDPAKSHSTCHIFISHQSLAEEKSLGKLFVMAEIRSGEGINAEIINTIQEEIKANYFNTDDLNIETAFEKALEKTNQKIADMIGDYDTNWLDRLHAVIAILKGDVLHLSSVGSLQTFLIRNQRITNIVQATANREVGLERVNPLKVFSHLISGTLQPGDAFLFCTPSLLDYLSQEKLKRTITDYNTHQAMASLERLLSEGSPTTAFAALLVKCEQEKVMMAQGLASPERLTAAPSSLAALTPQSSLDALWQKQEDTGKILSPSLSGYLWQSLKRGILSATDAIKLKIFRQSPRRVRWQREIKDTTRLTPPLAPEKVSRLVTYVPKTAGRMSASLMAGLKKVGLLFARKESPPAVSARAPRTMADRVASIIIAFKRLSRLSQLLLVGAVIVAFLLTQSIYSLASSQQSRQENKNVDQTVTTISEKITQAEAALTYKNEEGAKKLLNEAQDLITSLPSRTKKDKEEINELQTSLNVQLEKTKHIVVINTPQTITDIAKTDNTVGVSSLGLLGKTLYSADPAQKTVYSITLEGEVDAAPLATETTIQYLIPQNTKTLLILNTANKLDEYTIATKKSTPITFSFTTPDINIVAATVYESRLYFLDIKNNQILRSLRGAGGYSTPTAWIKDSTDVREAVSLAIDGNIYVLNKNGEIVRLSQGLRQSWSVASLEPALTKANKIWTDTTTDYLYILDSAGKRIVEFTKEGSFLNQYTSPAFDNLKDFIVDPAAKKIYLLNDTRILSVDLVS